MANIATASPQTPPLEDGRAVAPAWHTIIFLLVIFGLAGLQAAKLQVLEAHSRVGVYLAGTAFEILLVGYVWLLGLRPRGERMNGLIGGKWAKPKDVLRDIGVAFMFWFVVIVFLVAMRFALGDNPEGTRAVKMLLPRTAAEMASYVALCVTAGFCEEFLFRGYLQRQFFAWSGRREVAVALQALVFGVGHLYQGWKGALTITLYGALFGVLAVMQKSLRPGMIQHTMQDSFTGIAGSLLMKHGRL
jgi:uncharacterized protein